MFTRIQITVALAVATAAWGAVLCLQGTHVSWEHLAPFTTVVGVLVVVALAMEYVLWPFRIFQGWLFNRPDLRGTWKVTIQSEWPETGQRIPPITAYAGIAQTLSELQIHLMTPESESCLLAHAIEPTPCGNRFDVSVVYANTPGVELRGVRSERHVGAATISTHGAKYKPESMTAEYWTDRRTVGRMTFEGRVPTVYSRYEDAKRNLD
ncbi:hypothetical protein [Montanilutibacter psychrotolerans]|uniref:CD-NTase-associated protein 15 domain-containing protein n=1 Tax=Montanilutibacter psychrotolerans TaxID=1327343 RepID=A0A3M8SVD4_9GAMM|nr:hypothetical protein [Lysobacter psychrotolerans]RNF85259.1 hypothetical protein EER27_05695 [Lysobacter psychrotolerans]